MEIINYEELVNEYNDSLVNVLRGFRPKLAFIEMWVPDNDHFKSIVNLIETAQIHGEDTFTLFISESIWKSLDTQKLNKTLREFGRVEIQNQSRGATMQISELCGGDKSRSTQTAFEFTHPLYRENLKTYLDDIRYEKTLNEEEGLILIRSSFEGVSLFTLIDPVVHVIRDVSFAGSRSVEQKALLEAFCRVIDRMSIQEASDHGVLHLEYLLRDKTAPRPTQGILNVFNLDPMFQFPNQLIRALLADYRGKTGMKDTKNFWYPVASRGWRDMTDDQKIVHLQSFFDQHSESYFPAGSKVKITKIEQDVKVNVDFDGTLSNWEKGKGMMNIEPLVREKIEKRIQLYLEPVKDRNKARRL